MVTKFIRKDPRLKCNALMGSKTMLGQPGSSRGQIA